MIHAQPLDVLTPRVIAASGVKLSNTGDTNENTKATITIPANSMGPNGFVRVLVQATTTSNANTKDVRVKLGGTQFLNISQTSGAGLQAICIIQNRGATNSQIGFGSGSVGIAQGVGAATSPGSLDTTTDLSLIITAQCTTSGTDTIDIERYIVEVCYVP